LPSDALLCDCPLGDGDVQLTWPAVEEWVAVPGGGFVRGGEGVPVPLLDAQPTKKVQPPAELPEPVLKWSKSKRAWVLPESEPAEGWLVWSKSKRAFVVRAARPARPAPRAARRCVSFSTAEPTVRVFEVEDRAGKRACLREILAALAVVPRDYRHEYARLFEHSDPELHVLRHNTWVNTREKEGLYWLW